MPEDPEPCDLVTLEVGDPPDHGVPLEDLNTCGVAPC